MIKHRKKVRLVVFIFVFLLLVFLYLLSSTDLILKEQVDTIYSVSVIAEDTNSTWFTNYNLGIRQAIKEKNTDINYVSLQKENNLEQQIEMIKREVESGAQAIVLFPVSRQELEPLLIREQISIPFIFVNALAATPLVDSSISSDSDKKGKLLAKQVVGAASDSTKIVVFAESFAFDDVKNTYSSFKKECELAGYQIETYEAKEKGFKEQVDTLVKQNEFLILLGLDVNTLSRLSEYCKEQSESVLIYGNGYSNEVLYRLSKGQISGLVMQDEFAMGYLSIKAAVDALENKPVSSNTVVDVLSVTGEQIFLRDYERILFPVP